MNPHYFPHDNSARNDQKVLQLRFKCGAEGYGIYWMILETMAEDSTGYIDRGAIGGLSLGYGLPTEKVQTVFDVCKDIGLLMVCEHDNYFSPRMVAQKAELEKMCQYGKLGANKRWGTRAAKRSVKKRPHNSNEIKDVRAMQEEYSIGNEMKEENTIPPISPKGDACALSLSAILLGHIQEGGTAMKTPDLQKWAKTFDLMHRVDKRRWHWLQLIAEAARKDSFWEKNIRSPEKLRKHINNGNLDKFAPNEADVMSDTEFEAQCKTNTGT